MDAALQLVETGRYFAAKDMVPATSGNFSLRMGNDAIAITRSGVDKGEMTVDDIMVVDCRASAPVGSSAETELHLALYRDYPGVNAVLHVHSDSAAIASRLYERYGEMRLQGWELQKALAGVATHEAEIRLPVFPNAQDIPALARHVSSRLAAYPSAVAYLIAGHGLYAWGDSLAMAKRHVVALDHLLACALKLEELRR